MSETDFWGECKYCKWWQIEHEATVSDLTLGLCIDERLQPILLRVSGNSGCNRFILGEPARGDGSSARPPNAKPAR